MRLKIKKSIPFEFVFERLAELDPYTKPMFGCTSIYIGERIIFILRNKENHTEDNGVWLATSHEYHESLKRELPSLRSIELFGGKPTAWQNLPATDPGFEEQVEHACELVLQGDERIGHIPKKKSKKKSKR